MSKINLYSFQQIGVDFLINTKRCLLCDEMGLGKTVQSIFALNTLFDSPQLVNKCIILCPSSIKAQWITEIARFSTLKALQIDAGKQRYELYKKKYDILVMSYELFMIDSDCLEIDKKTVLICDEASKLKNPRAKVHKIVAAKSRFLNYFWCLTGTPIENNLQNIYTLVNLVKPYFMLWQEFTHSYCIVNEYFFKNKTIKKIDGYKRLDQFLDRIQHLFLRRKATEVNMPTVTINNEFFAATAQQKKLAKELYWFTDATEKNKFSILTLLRGIDDSPELLNYSESDLIKSLNLTNKPIVAIQEPKVARLFEILDETTEEKILIFTQFKQMALLLKERLKHKYDCIAMYGGSKTRDETLELFKTRQTTKKMILISTDVLSYGQNLQYINLLINFDLPWNPAKLAQRIGRIRRIDSEKRHKHVINLIGSLIDIHVFNIIKAKKDLFEQVVNGGAIKNEDIRKLVLEKIKF